jgi:hypothetical protein
MGRTEDHPSPLLLLGYCSEHEKNSIASVKEPTTPRRKKTPKSTPSKRKQLNEDDDFQAGSLFSMFSPQQQSASDEKLLSTSKTPQQRIMKQPTPERTPSPLGKMRRKYKTMKSSKLHDPFSTMTENTPENSLAVKSKKQNLSPTTTTLQQLLKEEDTQQSEISISSVVPLLAPGSIPSTVQSPSRFASDVVSHGNQSFSNDIIKSHPESNISKRQPTRPALKKRRSDPEFKQQSNWQSTLPQETVVGTAAAAATATDMSKTTAPTNHSGSSNFSNEARESSFAIQKQFLIHSKKNLIVAAKAGAKSISSQTDTRDKELKAASNKNLHDGRLGKGEINLAKRHGSVIQSKKDNPSSLPADDVFYSKFDGSGSKPIHPIMINFMLDSMKQVSDQVVDRIMEQVKSSKSKKDDSSSIDPARLRLSLDGHCEKVLTRVRHRLRTTKLPGHYIPIPDHWSLNNLPERNEHRKLENEKSLKLLQKMRWKRQQLEEMLEAEQSRTVQLEARRTAMEKAGRACMHPLLRYSLDQEEQQQQQMKNSKSNDSQLVSSSKDQQQDMYSVPSAPPHVADQYMEAWVQEYQNEQKQPLSHVDDTLWPSSSSTGKEMTRDESENTSSSSSSSSSSLLSSLESESSDDDE